MFQISTGENATSAISTAAYGYGLLIQRMRQSGTSTKAMMAGANITTVNFESSDRPPNRPAASHQRGLLLSLSRTSDHIIATENGITAMSGATFAVNSP